MNFLVFEFYQLHDLNFLKEIKIFVSKFDIFGIKFQILL